ncbi:hypothetical protein HZ993_09260 [Rhodoferax sp. AJA081-3]|uniref:hypothetical protein n=1 Tax=Rhodoferax sp. AJA081-3 TaxID=2752316 RepID=UPI001ADEF4CE|nr:hypothetical protein [Rhodoferax sp. AJA081-3]QTN29969.1 hypothetical protein HZ993_09260 [Rhodoferax sp. AJA081-3]
MADEKFYSAIADELEHKKTDRALWTRALAEAGGDVDKTTALYIRLRLAQLKRADVGAGTLALEPVPGDETSNNNRGGHNTQPPSSALIRLRSDLSKMLRESGKSSFYTVLDLTPEATDAEVADAIASYEARVASGDAFATPEFKYARESLGNSRSREAYDRRIFSSAATAGGPTSRYPSRGHELSSVGEPVLVQLWESRKASVIVGAVCLCIVGYMLLGFYKEREASAMRKKEIEAQILQTQKNAENDAIRAEAEKALAAGMVNNTANVIDRTSQMGNRALDRQLEAENRQRIESEQRAINNAQRLEMQREAQDRQLAMQEQRTREAKRQMDDRRAEREKRYWACMNTALDRNSESTANARCAAYR